MAWFNPTPLEISTIEQIETAVVDPTLLEERRRQLMCRLWSQLEAAHGCKVISLVSPEGQVIRSPFAENGIDRSDESNQTQNGVDRSDESGQAQA